MGLDLGYKVDVAAIPIEILSKFPLLTLQNALEHCHVGRGSLGEASLRAFKLILALIFLKLQHNRIL